MKKIGLLLFVCLLDVIFLAAGDGGNQGLPDPIFPVLLGMATLMITLILFYDGHFKQAHSQWSTWVKKSNRHYGVVPGEYEVSPSHAAHPQMHVHDAVALDSKHPGMHSHGAHAKAVHVESPGVFAMDSQKEKRSIFKKPQGHNLTQQYEFVDLVRQEIVEMKKNGSSDGEIITHLKEEEWDPQVIYIALSRAKKGEKAK